MKKKLLKICILVILGVVSVLIVIFTPSLSNGTSKLVDDEFILTFLSFFSGLSIAIITLIFSNIEKIKATLFSKNEDDKDFIEQIDLIIKNVFREFKHDTISILICLVGCFFLIIIRDIDFKSFVILTSITKLQIISIIEIFFYLNTFIAVFDLFITLFLLVKTTFSKADE